MGDFIVGLAFGSVITFCVCFMYVLSTNRFVMNTKYKNEGGYEIYVDSKGNYWHLEQDYLSYRMHGNDKKIISRSGEWVRKSDEFIPDKEGL